MNKRHSIHLLLAAAALLLATAACTQDDPSSPSGGVEGALPEGQYPLEIAGITLGVEGGEAQPWGAPQTRVGEGTDGTGSTFSAGDRVAVQINGEEGIYIVQDNNTVKAETPLYWSDRNYHTVTAWYPATGGILDLGNQSQSLAYLLYGTGSGNYQTPVKLTFAHQLAKVRVTPSDNALGEVQSLQLYTYTQCTYEKGKVVQGTTADWIEMKQCSYNGTTCWEANVVPGKEITRLRANGTEERNLSTTFTPEAGVLYNITLDKEDPGYTEVSEGNYTVDNGKGLKNLAKLVNEQWNLGINITLTADIDLSGIDWTPIGIDYNHRYTGTFDGGGHTITGLTVTGSNEYAGLFGYIGKGGKVKDVTLEDVQIATTNSFGHAGGMAGYCKEGTLENCFVSGDVSGKFSGGVVGELSVGSLTGCGSSAAVAGTVGVGGVAGYVWDTTLTACYATGDVTIENNDTGAYYAGGVVGNNHTSTLQACYAWGSVTGSGSGTIYVGGVTGSNDEGTLQACYHAKGTVSCPDGTTGGVVGWNYKYSSDPVITACYWGSNPSTGIGENQAGTGETKQVTDGKWSEAKDAMNTALNGLTTWSYNLSNDKLPVLVQNP